MSYGISKFEVVNHGIENPDYFGGCGVAFTSYDHVVTGWGCDFAEAMEDALDSIAQQHNGIDFPAFEQAIKADLGVTTASWPTGRLAPEDMYYYVSIRYSLENTASFNITLPEGEI